MNSLVNLNNLTFNNKKITVILDDKNIPWFYGNEIAELLGYERPRDAIKKHIKEKYIINFENILCSSKTTLPNSIQNITKFTNEFGLYQLIMKSKLPIAETFQDWVFEEVLPSIRKHGEYTLSEKFKKQLELKDKELEQAKKQTLQIQTYINNTRIVETKDEWIYIATTKQYAAYNIFKIGSTTRITKRISDYQTGRHQNDNYYYCYARQVYNSKDLDFSIKKSLYHFLCKKNSELYCLYFDSLVELVDMLIDKGDISTEYINDFIKYRLKDVIILEPIIPEPILFNNISYTINNKTETIDIRNTTINELKELLRDILDLYIKQNKTNISRSELINTINVKCNKNLLWNSIKSILNWENSKTPIVYKNKELYLTYK